MARGYSYVLKRDYGFAPNPFYGFLTLATCKPKIRSSAQVGDFIIGNAPADLDNKLVFMAKVSKVITFNDYWNNQEYACKKPIMNGSLKKLYGDNIYYQLGNGEWMQENSHHSNQDGSINTDNLTRDTGTTDHVLIADEFFYFGKSMINVPAEYTTCIHTRIGHHNPDIKICNGLWDYLCKNYEMGLIDLPRQFKEFIRYDGKS